LYERDVGLNPSNARLLSACNGTEYFIASLIPIFTIEKFGRRQLMMFGATGMSISMAVLAGTVSISDSSFAAGIVAAVFLFVFNTFFAIGWLGMTWLYPSEIVPLRIRAQSSALSTSSNWIFNVSSHKSFSSRRPVLTQTFPVLDRHDRTCVVCKHRLLHLRDCEI
jgi:hypothetical protein